MVGLVQRKLNRSLLRACIGSADDGQLYREACVVVMNIHFLPRMMFVGSRCTFIGMSGGVDNLIVHINYDGDLRLQWCVVRSRERWCGGCR